MTDAAAPQPNHTRGGRGARFWILVLVIGASIIVAGVLIYNASIAAFTATTTTTSSFSTGVITLEDDDFGGAGLSLAGLVPGDSGSASIDVTYEGDGVTSEIRVYSDAEQSTDEGLAAQIGLTISTDAGAEVWSGTLLQFQGLTTFEGGVLPLTVEDAATVTYTVNYEVLASAPQGASAAVAFVWEAQSTTTP